MKEHSELIAHLERDDLTIEELVKAAEGLLEVMAPKQTRYKVTDRPDVRTIRYYTSQRLLPRPVNYEGGRARYSGSHLIRLLLIKKLQAEHYTLAKIAAVLREASDDAVLDALVPERTGQTDVVGEAVVLEQRDRGEDAVPIVGPRVEKTRRVHLAPGGTLDVPEDVLQSPTRRQELADALEALAQMLRKEQEQ